jgi:hypothetical protein
MLEMQKFHKLLSKSSKRNGSYFKTLMLFTRLSPAQLVAMTTGTGWEPW